MRQVYTKLLSELVKLVLISGTQGQVYTYNRGSFPRNSYISRAWSKIYSSRQPPPGVTKWRHTMAHKWYGAPCGIKDDVWMHLYWYCVGSGIRIVQMDLITPTHRILTQYTQNSAARLDPIYMFQYCQNLWIERLILCLQFVLCCTCKTYESKGWLVPVLWHCCCTKNLLLVLISSKYSLFHNIALLLWGSL